MIPHKTQLFSNVPCRKKETQNLEKQTKIFLEKLNQMEAGAVPKPKWLPQFQVFRENDGSYWAKYEDSECLLYACGDSVENLVNDCIRVYEEWRNLPAGT
jgi:hypothetical protein